MHSSQPEAVCERCLSSAGRFWGLLRCSRASTISSSREGWPSTPAPRVSRHGEGRAGFGTPAHRGGRQHGGGHQAPAGSGDAYRLSVPVSLQMHRFWDEKDPEARQREMTNFLKNMALVGAALAMMEIGVPWPVSVDAARADEEMFIRLGGRDLMRFRPESRGSHVFVVDGLDAGCPVSWPVGRHRVGASCGSRPPGELVACSIPSLSPVAP